MKKRNVYGKRKETWYLGRQRVEDIVVTDFDKEKRYVLCINIVTQTTNPWVPMNRGRFTYIPALRRKSMLRDTVQKVVDWWDNRLEHTAKALLVIAVAAFATTVLSLWTASLTGKRPPRYELIEVFKGCEIYRATIDGVTSLVALCPAGAPASKTQIPIKKMT